MFAVDNIIAITCVLNQNTAVFTACFFRIIWILVCQKDRPTDRRGKTPGPAGPPSLPKEGRDEELPLFVAVYGQQNCYCDTKL